MADTAHSLGGRFRLVAKDRSRDIYALSEHSQLVVYTDRLYAYEHTYGVEMRESVPGKGIMLNQISTYWMGRFTHMAANDLLVQDASGFPPELLPYAAELAGRSVIVRKFKPLPFQFFTLGSLGGDDWQAYRETNAVRGYHLPRGLQESERLEQAVLIPLADGGGKGDDGRKRAQRLLGQKTYAAVEEVCLSVFGVARNYAAARGLTLADARFICAAIDGKICLLHEVLTPDTATYWPGDVTAGEPQPVFERQNMYSWLKVQRWNPKEPPPALPPALIGETVKRYQTLCDIMTGKVATLKKQEEAEETENGA